MSRARCRSLHIKTMHYGITLLILLLASPATASPVRVSLLSILQPDQLTFTLKNPDRAVLQADTWNRPIAAGVRIPITLNNNRLETAQNGATPSLRIHCEQPCAVEIDIPQKIKRVYTGDLTFEASHSAIGIVLQMPEEDLVASITASEMGEHRRPEALMAFAIVARSFLRAGSRHPELGADFCDLTHCQVFQAHTPTVESSDAVRKTTGLILTFKQMPFRPFYSRSCGGKTARFEEVWNEPAADYPFATVQCPCNVRWETTLLQKELDALAGFSGTRIRQATGKIVLHASTHQGSYTLEQFRILAGRHLGWNRIRSNDFVLSTTDSGVTIAGNGIGHRVGFCQIGSVLLAAKGIPFQEILRHYFPNAEIRNSN